MLVVPNSFLIGYGTLIIFFQIYLRTDGKNVYNMQKSM